MPTVRMPDGALVEMPDNPSPELRARLEKFLSTQGQPQQQFSALNPPSIEDTAGHVTQAPQQDPNNFDAQAEANKVSDQLSAAGNFIKDTAIGMIPGANLYREFKTPDTPPAPGEYRSPFRNVDRFVGAAAADALNLAAAAPLAGKVLKPVLRSLPGAAPILQEEAIAAARKVPGEAIQGPAAQPLWQQFKSSGAPNIKADRIVSSIDNAVEELSKAANPNSGAINFLGNIKNRIVDGGGYIPIDALDADRRAIGQFIRSTEGGGGIHGLADQIYSAFDSTLEDAIKGGAAGPGRVGKAATDLRAAIQASKKDFAREDLANLIEQRIRTRAGDNLQSINIASIKDALRKTEKGKQIIDRLGAGEVAQIEGMLNQINPPSLPPPGGANFGSGKFLKTEGLLSGLGYLLSLGDPRGAAAGAAIGAAAQGTEYWLSRFLMTKPGRDFLRTLSNANLSANPAAVPALYQTMNTLINRNGEEKK